MWPAVFETSMRTVTLVGGREARVGATYGFADRLRVVAVILGALEIRSHQARHHDANAVAMRLKLAHLFVPTSARLQ
jgi:hypothetical protein